jgi:uncharacterized OsmC-like protein
MGQDDIAAAIGRARAYLTANPAEACYRDSPATASVEDGLRVRVSGPDGEPIVTDMVTGVGGGGSAPSPGWMFRAAYASCVATLIAMRAAEEGVALSDVRVTVDSESDDRGILGIDPGVPAGPLSVRLVVAVAAGEGVVEAAVRRVVEYGVAHCPVHDLVARAVPVEVVVEFG